MVPRPVKHPCVIKNHLRPSVVVGVKIDLIFAHMLLITTILYESQKISLISLHRLVTSCELSGFKNTKDVTQNISVL